MHDIPSENHESSSELSREELLKRALAAGITLALPATFVGSAAAQSGEALRGIVAAPKRGGTLTMARSEEPTSLDPGIPGDNGSIFTIQQIFDQLTKSNRASTDVIPGIASSWEISKDKKTYTFRIRDNARFSDGSQVTAEDVVFSLQRAIKGGYGFLLERIATVKAVGSKTVRITLKGPYTPMLQNLNIFAASILPKAKFQASPAKFALNPVGTGPFKLQKWVKGQYVQLARNEHYWRSGHPYLDEVVIKYVSDDNTRIVKLQAGEADVATAIPFASAHGLNAGNTKVLAEPLFRLDLIWLNHQFKPLGDKKVRQALNYATDKEAIHKSVYFGYGQVANHGMCKMAYWRKDIHPYPYDLAKAKQLMKQSSYPNGFTVEMKAWSGNAWVQQIAQIVKQSWAQIGVKVNIVNLDLNTALGDLFKENYQSGANWLYTNDVIAPDEALQLFNFWGSWHGGFAGYKEPKIPPLIAAASVGDEKARAKVFGEIQQIVMDDAWAVPLVFTPALTGIRSNVRGFGTYQAGWWALEDTWLA